MSQSKVKGFRRYMCGQTNRLRLRIFYICRSKFTKPLQIVIKIFRRPQINTYSLNEGFKSSLTTSSCQAQQVEFVHNCIQHSDLNKTRNPGAPKLEKIEITKFPVDQKSVKSKSASLNLSNLFEWILI